MNRFDRITAIFVQLQAKRQVQGRDLMERFGVSLRTIYRDLRSLEAAGVPLRGVAGGGYSLAEGYRLPPVMFTREEAAALLTAEKLLGQLTDAPTVTHSARAMDKLRTVLRQADRDYLESLAPCIEVLPPTLFRGAAALHHLGEVRHHLLNALATHRVVRLHYWALHDGQATQREVEPIGLYYGQCWHLVAFCRLRQELRDFRLDRVTDWQVQAEEFSPRPDTLQSYRQQQAAREPLHTAVVRFTADALPLLHDSKHYYGWVSEQPTPSGGLEMTLHTSSLLFLSRWLLAFAQQVTIVSPVALHAQLRTLALAAAAHFAPTLQEAGNGC